MDCGGAPHRPGSINTVRLELAVHGRPGAENPGQVAGCHLPEHLFLGLDVWGSSPTTTIHKLLPQAEVLQPDYRLGPTKIPFHFISGMWETSRGPVEEKSDEELQLLSVSDDLHPVPVEVGGQAVQDPRYCNNLGASGGRAAKTAMRTAAQVHPNHPTFLRIEKSCPWVAECRHIFFRVSVGKE